MSPIMYKKYDSFMTCLYYLIDIASAGTHIAFPRAV